MSDEGFETFGLSFRIALFKVEIQDLQSLGGKSLIEAYQEGPHHGSLGIMSHPRR